VRRMENATTRIEELKGTIEARRKPCPTGAHKTPHGTPFRACSGVGCRHLFRGATLIMDRVSGENRRRGIGRVLGVHS
jgi:hypothetical protein